MPGSPPPTPLPSSVEPLRTYAAKLAEAVAGDPEATLVGVYLHGSAALGGFSPAGSDVDVLGVLAAPVEEAVQRRLGTALIDAALPCPGTGLEMSLITAATAAELDDCRFEVHVAVDEHQIELVVGAGHPGDPDLILHAEVCRRQGVIVHGPPPGQVFAPVPLARLRGAIAAELRWSLDHGSLPYAVLNACRALRFNADGVLDSKLSAGAWVLERHPDRAVIAEALAQQRAATPMPLTPDAIRFVSAVAGTMDDGVPRSGAGGR